jgi:hypothetical protein
MFRYSAFHGFIVCGTHYGFYNTIVGMGTLVGNLATGSLMQAAPCAPHLAGLRCSYTLQGYHANLTKR